MKSIIENEYRCDCGKLLFKGFLLDSRIEIKCKRCGRIKILSGAYEGEIGTHDYSIVYDKTGKVFSASQTAEKFLGYSNAEIENLSAQDINPMLSKEVFEKTWSLAGETENFMHWQSYHRKKDGSKVYVEAKINVYVWLGQEYLLFLFKTLEDSKRRDGGAITEDVSQFLRDFVIEIDWRGEIIYSSQEVAEILGYQPLEIFGRSIFELMPDDQTIFTKNKLDKLLKAAQSFRISDIVLKSKQGEIFRIDSFFTTIFDQNQEIWGYRCLNWIKK